MPSPLTEDKQLLPPLALEGSLLFFVHAIIFAGNFDLQICWS